MLLHRRNRKSVAKRSQEDRRSNQTHAARSNSSRAAVIQWIHSVEMWAGPPPPPIKKRRPLIVRGGHGLGVGGRQPFPHDFGDDRISRGTSNAIRALSLMPALQVKSGTAAQFGQIGTALSPIARDVDRKGDRHPGNNANKSV